MTTRTPAIIMRDFNTLLDEARQAGIKCTVTPMFGGYASVAIMFNGDVKLTEDYELLWKHDEEQASFITQNE